MTQSQGPFGITGGPILTANLPPASEVAQTTYAFTSDQGLLVTFKGQWIPAASYPNLASTATSAVNAAVRKSMNATATVKGAPFTANDSSVLLDIGLPSLGAQNSWTDVLNSSMVPVVFASAPSSTSGTLSLAWGFPSSTNWQVVLSTGQTITGCTFTYGSTSVTLGSSVTGSPTASGMATLFVYNSATGSSLTAAGYITGSVTGNANGQIVATGFDCFHGLTGTVYTKVARAAISCDISQGSTSQWYDSNGSASAGGSGSYPPTLWQLIDATGDNYVSFTVLPGAGMIQYGASGQRASFPPGQFVPTNVPNMGANYDPTYCEIVVTWRPITIEVALTTAVSDTDSATLAESWPYQTSDYWPLQLTNGSFVAATLTNGATTCTWSGNVSGGPSGTIATTQMLIYMDNILVVNGILAPNSTTGLAQLQNGQFYQVTIGNNQGSANAYLGGQLGPYLIERFQISSAFYAPPISDCIVGFYGDSYTAGGGTNGSGIFPGVATAGTMLQDTQTLGAPDNPNAAQINVGLSNVNGPVSYWVANLEAYCKKNLGFYFPAFGAAKSGYASYWTGAYTAAAAFPTPQITFTGALSSATSGTLASVTINGVSYFGGGGWPGATGGWFVTFPGGSQRLCALTLNGTTCTWTGAVTDANTASQPSAVYTTGYWDGLIAMNPEIIVYWDNVNNGYECPDTTGAGENPIADTSYMFNYWASRCANLRAIIFVEMMSLELLPSTLGGNLTPAQWATVSAKFRLLHRGHYNAGSALAGQGSVTYTNASGIAVPVLYVPTYESMAGKVAFGNTTVASASQNTSTGLFATGSQAFTAGLPVQISGTAPTGFSTSKTYYVIASGLTSSACKLSATVGGTAIVPSVSHACTLEMPYAQCLIIGSNPTNFSTSGSYIGPTGTTPDIHPAPDGEIAIADLIWPVLMPYLQNRTQWTNA